jgi:hypothetical protein
MRSVPALDQEFDFGDNCHSLLLSITTALDQEFNFGNKISILESTIWQNLTFWKNTDNVRFQFAQWPKEDSHKLCMARS